MRVFDHVTHCHVLYVNYEITVDTVDKKKTACIMNETEANRRF